MTPLQHEELNYLMVQYVDPILEKVGPLLRQADSLKEYSRLVYEAYKSLSLPVTKPSSPISMPMRKVVVLCLTGQHLQNKWNLTDLLYQTGLDSQEVKKVVSAWARSPDLPPAGRPSIWEASKDLIGRKVSFLSEVGYSNFELRAMAHNTAESETGLGHLEAQFCWAKARQSQYKDKDKHLLFTGQTPPFYEGVILKPPTRNTGEAILPKSTDHGDIYEAAAYAFKHFSTTPKGIKMTQPIQTITYIYGVDISTMNEEALIRAIRTIEKDMDSLKGIKTKSTKLDQKAKELDDALAVVVAALDKL